jgi:hypothetical protein
MTRTLPVVLIDQAGSDGGRFSLPLHTVSVPA